jgi:hypothetical protein
MPGGIGHAESRGGASLFGFFVHTIRISQYKKGVVVAAASLIFLSCVEKNRIFLGDSNGAHVSAGRVFVIELSLCS